jgi:UPF0716 protein FxsA
MWLFILFVAVPILEIALFIQVGGWLGLWPTLGIVVLTALAGTILVRTQGLETVRRLKRNLAEGRDPVSPIAHGALILVAGVLLLTPGFFTDAVALALLVPPVRAALIAWGAARLTVVVAGPRPPPRNGTGPGPETVEGDYEVLDPPPPGTPRGRPEKVAPPPDPRRSGASRWTRPPN